MRQFVIGIDKATEIAIRREVRRRIEGMIFGARKLREQDGFLLRFGVSGLARYLRISLFRIRRQQEDLTNTAFLP